MRLHPSALLGQASLAFVSLGLPDGLLGVAWPSMRNDFTLPLHALRAASDLVALTLAGAAAGPIFPSLIATTSARVGLPHAANTIGMQIAAAALGQALVPSFLGARGRRHGLDAITLAFPVQAVGIVILFVLMQRSPSTPPRLAPVSR